MKKINRYAKVFFACVDRQDVEGDFFKTTKTCTIRDMDRRDPDRPEDDRYGNGYLEMWAIGPYMSREEAENAAIAAYTGQDQDGNGATWSIWCADAENVYDHTAYTISDDAEAQMKLVGDITNASIYLDEEKNLFYVDPDSSKGFYFDEQDLSGIGDGFFKKEAKDLIEKFINAEVGK